MRGRYEPTKEKPMTMMTEQEFLEIWFNQRTDQVEIEYRLYYDEQGWPLFYSTERVEGNYVVIDRQTYLDSPKHIRIVDGKIKRIKVLFGKKLVPAEQGQACDSTDVCVIVADQSPSKKWAIKHEEPEEDEAS